MEKNALKITYLKKIKAHVKKIKGIKLLLFYVNWLKSKF